MSDLVMVPQPEAAIEVQVGKEERAHTVYHEMVSLKRMIDGSFLKMAKYMREVRDEKLYLHFGCSNLEEFCYKKLDIGRRQVSNYVKDYECYVEKLQIPEQELLEVGSTKLMILSDVVNEGNVEELLDYAKESNVRDVYNRRSILLGNEGLDRVEDKIDKLSFWQIPVNPSIRKLANETLELAKREVGTDNILVAFEAILASYLAGLNYGSTRSTVSFVLTEEEKKIVAQAIDLMPKTGDQNLGGFIVSAIRTHIEKYFTTVASDH